MLAFALLALGVAHGQPPVPSPSNTAFPIRFATHGTPGPETPRDVDLVVGVVVGGEARAYPLSLLWGENAHTVNDHLGGAPIAVALCPLAGASAAFDRRRGGGSSRSATCPRRAWTPSCSTTPGASRTGVS